MAAIAGLGSFRSAFVSEVADRLTEAGVGVTDQRLMMAARLVAAARAQAAHDCINGVAANPLVDPPVNVATSSNHTFAQVSVGPYALTAPMASAPEVAAPSTSAISPSGPWATMTTHDIASHIIEMRPGLFAHRATGKRATQQTGEQTKRQILWAATPFDKSRQGRPFWERSREDVSNSTNGSTGCRCNCSRGWLRGVAVGAGI